jgi:hypothetical protein
MYLPPNGFFIVCNPVFAVDIETCMGNRVRKEEVAPLFMLKQRKEGAIADSLPI